MYAVNSRVSRIVGLTSLDSDATFFIGKRQFTARGLRSKVSLRSPMDWLPLGSLSELGDRLSRYPQASGHGHRP